MKFEYGTVAASGWAEISTEPTDFDAVPPLEKLRVNWPLESISVDRAVVSTSLVFSSWIAGRCDFPEPFSALTAQRITEWFQSQSIWVSPNPIRTGGLPLPRGNKRLILSGDSRRTNDIQLHLEPSERGTTTDGEAFHIATNAGVLMANAPTPAARLGIRLGIAVLVSESLGVDEVIDPEFAAESPQEFASAARFIECVALGLRGA